MTKKTNQYFAAHRFVLAFAFVGLTACGSSNLNTPLGGAIPNSDGLANHGFVDAAGTTSNTPTAFSINVTDRDNLTAAQSQKLDQAVALADRVMNSQAFKDRVLNFTYNGQKQFYQNLGLTNAEIYATLMAGAEQYPSVSLANNMADMKISIYYPAWYSASSAVAFTNTSDPFLHIYSSYFSSSSLPDLAETIVHEWTHKMGFDHDYNSTAPRPYSVPYGIGGIVWDVASAMN